MGASERPRLLGLRATQQHWQTARIEPDRYARSCLKTGSIDLPCARLSESESPDGVKVNLRDPACGRMRLLPEGTGCVSDLCFTAACARCVV
eukprot:363169-Chlamydomonas_euryale.AAC.9